MDKSGKYYIVKERALPESFTEGCGGKASDRFREGDDCTGSNRCHGYQQKFFL